MSVNTESSSKSISSNRILDYKSRTVISSQEIRRLELLENQKRKRKSLLHKIRNFTESLSDLEIENDLVSEQYYEMECLEEGAAPKPKFPRLTTLFMFSEWMINVPENLKEKWLFVLCPVGKRCLVKASKGHTTVYGRHGNQLAKFQSALPNGSYKDFEKTKYSNSEITILDCIWNSQLKCYFVLDMLSWKGQFYMDTEASFRAFWIKSKITETPWLSEKSEQNPFPFFLLEYHSYDCVTLSSIFSSHVLFSSHILNVDGILFYHSEAYYTPGQSPLVVWLKPFMLPEMLGIEVSDIHMQSQPESYVNMMEYINEYELKKRKRKKQKNFDKSESMDVEKEQEEIKEVEMIE